MTDPAFVGHIVLDVPAQEPTLRFDQIGRALATIVRTSPPRFAVGIFGGWGSGKSTLMDEIKRQLVESGHFVVDFNAWRYEREPHLIVPLLDTIRDGLATWAVKPGVTAGNAEKLKNIARRVGQVVRALVRAASVDIGLPGAVSISVDPGKALDEMTDAHDVAGSPQSLYFAAFKELTSAFAEVRDAGVDRIVVMVDDLDRCLPEQALTVLESMKLFFDMLGFVFVVGLDENVVKSAVRTKFAVMAPGSDDPHETQLERDYLKKIFQVPYTLPAMMSGQLDDLLRWLYQHGGIEGAQQQDLRDRVSRYLDYVGTDGRLNPREVKRFINAYTLSRMIRSDLDADTLLALQTMDFRTDWDVLYDNVLLSEPDIFAQALSNFVDNRDDHAFEDLWPQVGVLSAELAAFLRSPEAAGLRRPDLAGYVSFLETTRTAQSWVTEAMRDVGVLRAQVRAVGPTFVFGTEAAREVAGAINAALRRLIGYEPTVAGLAGPLARLQALAAELAPPTALGDDRSSAEAAGRADRWRADASAQTDAIQQALRVVRRATRFAS
jgi:hypothetical protein